jgi:hypothetical protein
MASEFWVANLDAWALVGVGDYPDAPFSSPANGAPDVLPWPTTLQWEIFGEEKTWEVQIDTNPKFFGNDPDLRTIPVFGTSNVNGINVALAVANLRPATTYYWRVRANLPDSPDLSPCYRPTQSFTTATQLPLLLSPVPGDDASPWDLAFQWNAPKGALSYDFTVTAPGYAPYLEHVIACSASKDADCEERQNLPVDSDFSWSVKAHGPVDLYNPNEAVAQAGPLHTLMPKGTPTSISSTVWPATFKWGTVQGAASYDVSLYVQSKDPPYQFDSLYWSKPEFSGTSVELYLNPNVNENRLGIRPVGPTVILGKDVSAQRGEEGFESALFDGDDAWVQMFTPDKSASKCLAQSGVVNVTWQPIPHARSYTLRRFEFNCPFPSGDCSRGTQVGQDEVVVQDPGSLVGARDLPSFPVTFSTPLGAGYVIEIVGKPLHLGPNGEDWDSKCAGFDECVFSQGRYFVQPEAPDAFSPPSGAVQEGLDSTLKWKTQLANGGSFYIEAFKNSDCSGDPHFTDTKDVAWSAGETWYGIHWGVPGWPASTKNLQKSWRVRPTGIFSPCDQSPRWSNCNSIVVNKECGGENESCCTQSEACGANLVCVSDTCKRCGMEGGPCCDKGQACFPGLQCASGTCSPPANRVKCGQTVQPGGGTSTLPESYVIDLGGTEGTFWFAYDTVDVPDRIVIRRGNIPQSGDIVATTDDISAVPGGCVGDKNGAMVTVGPGSNFVNVTVYPNCKGPGTTAWAFLVDCVSSNEYPTPPTE